MHDAHRREKKQQQGQEEKTKGHNESCCSLPLTMTVAGVGLATIAAAVPLLARMVVDDAVLAPGHPGDRLGQLSPSAAAAGCLLSLLAWIHCLTAPLLAVFSLFLSSPSGHQY